ncbi:hypothetical protein [Paracoccus sp. (in: a-proteobacteria)]|uniref:hypothetical protein n=1 Tax=Paracoccus sp. TaxID=267 RepID=UPI0035AE789D
MATLTQHQPLTLEYKNVSKLTFDFAALTKSPGYGYSAGGVVQYGTSLACAWCNKYGGNWGLGWNKTKDAVTLDFGTVLKQVYVVFYPTHGTSTMTVVPDAPAPAPVPLPAAGGLLGVALLGAMVWKKLVR